LLICLLIRAATAVPDWIGKKFPAGPPAYDVAMERCADVIVVGLGAMGSAACHRLALRGAAVIGIDRHEPPHAHGSTHGETRITRLAIGEGPEFVPLVRRSHELWPLIERDSGAALLRRTGALILGRAGDPFLARTREVARLHGIAHENLGPGEIAARFPMFTADPATEAYFEPGAGYVRPEAAVAAQLELARAHGARLALGERVLRWSASSSGVTVVTDAGTYEAGELVLCAGAWIGELFPEGRDLFVVHRQVMSWFAIREGYEQLSRMPVFIWELPGAQEEFTHALGFYGFPAIDGPGGGVKVAVEAYNERVDPDAPRRAATAAEIAEMHRRHIAPHLPWLGPDAVRSASCLYTNTRTSAFVIDRHPAHEHVLIVSACSGHGFKHSPAIGEAVAQWIVDGAAEIDLAPFGLK